MLLGISINSKLSTPLLQVPYQLVMLFAKVITELALFDSSLFIVEPVCQKPYLIEPSIFQDKLRSEIQEWGVALSWHWGLVVIEQRIARK